jgi:hypothetical protein
MLLMKPETVLTLFRTERTWAADTRSTLGGWETESLKLNAATRWRVLKASGTQDWLEAYRK